MFLPLLSLVLATPNLTSVELATPRGPVAAAVDSYAIVRLRDGITPDELVACGAHGVRLLAPSLSMWLVESDARREDGVQLAARLRACEDAERLLVYAEPNLWLRRTLSFSPNDPRFPGQWYFDDLAMQKAWDLTRGDPSVTIVVVDNGCQATHPDLVLKLDAGRDVIDSDNDPSPESSSSGAEHGTACAGIVGASTNNDEGIAGGCPECRVRCVRMLSSAGELVPVSADVDAFQFALDVDAAVVSNSWGFVDAIAVPKALRDVIELVHDTGRGGLGAVVVFAVGNDDRELGDNELQAVRGVLGVGAINTYGEKTSFTNYGPSVDLVAPTGTITTDLTGSAGGASGDYTSSFGGTSSACPVAAGIAGLVVSAMPAATAAEITQLLIDTTGPAPYAAPDANGHDAIYGYGVIDPVAALEQALGVDGDTKKSSDDDGGCSSTGAGVAGWLVLGWLAAMRLRAL